MIDRLSVKDGQRLIIDIMKTVHRPHWQRVMSAEWDPYKPVVYYEETNFAGKSFNVPVIVLRTNPCHWFVNGGCVMCNFMIEAGNISQSINSLMQLQQVQWILDHF